MVVIENKSNQTYPTQSDIEQHKEKVWQMLVLLFKDMTPEMNGIMKISTESVGNAIRSLAGDASLWVYNNESKQLDLSKVGKFISTLKIVNIEQE